MPSPAQNINSSSSRGTSTSYHFGLGLGQFKVRRHSELLRVVYCIQRGLLEQEIDFGRVPPRRDSDSRVSNRIGLILHRQEHTKLPLWGYQDVHELDDVGVTVRWMVRAVFGRRDSVVRHQGGRGIEQI